MRDPFGNYLVQKLVEHCTEDQLRQAVTTIKAEPLVICKDLHGTRSVQKLVEVLTHSPHKRLLEEYLLSEFVKLTFEINGNHVIQKILNSWQPADKQFIYEAMMSNCAEIACHMHGCCIMQKCIDAANSHQKKHLILKIASHTRIFVKDAFANYVI
mmetsp:Transcript_533/g.669  ORF Transcript_533/g.669 Transcript_533/m.669 type:complete len:156 (+) Transcript_533:2064-2531(+)